MRRIITLTFIALLLSGCGQTAMADLPAATSMPAAPTLIIPATSTSIPATYTPKPPTSTPIPTATPKPQPLVVCGQHPFAINPYAPSPGGYDIQAFLYTFPVEREAYQWVPRLVTHIPSFSSGDVLTHNITVQREMPYVNTDNLVNKYTGSEPLTLTQMVVTYTLKAELYWSDSHPLTSRDVVFGYSLAQMAEAYGPWRQLAERTLALTAIDDQCVRWEGLPGFASTNYPGFLFPPQPSHKWQDMNLTEILMDRNPPVNGPYRIGAWDDDASITLEANPYFYGEPARTEWVIMRYPEAKSSSDLDMLMDGTCDILFPDNNKDNWERWLQVVENEQAVIWSSPSSTVLRLDFNLSPPTNRPNLLSLPRTRLGLANCVSRENLMGLSPGLQALPAMSFIPPSHPADDPTSIWRVPFSLEVGRGVLDEIGWRDEDGDGIREAHEVEGIKNGTPLTLTLATSTLHRPVADMMAADFRRCGVGVIIDAKGPQQYYAASSVSPLYARDFQLALYGWQADLPDGCAAWLSDHLPADGFDGDELNYGGYQNTIYDEQCRIALGAVDVDQQYLALNAAQAVLADDLATLFLTWQPRWIASQPKVKGIVMDISTFGRISHPESIIIENGE